MDAAWLDRSRHPGRLGGMLVARTAALSIVASLLAFAAAGAEAAVLVRHPLVQSIDDRRAEYPVAVLRLALEKAGVDARIVPAAVGMEQDRAIRSLASGRLIDVMWSVSTAERERQLRVVRIPIDRGLIGWRVLLVRRDARPRFDGVTGVEQLAVLLGAQGHDWPDLTILQANGLRVLPTPHYQSLFELLKRNRVDYVPRGVGEVLPELRAMEGEGLAVEHRLLLHYPTALYFFVHPENKALAEQLDRGLRLAVTDGSLRRLFDDAYGEDIAALHLARRHRIELANPLLTPSMSVGHPGWWFTPEEVR